MGLACSLLGHRVRFSAAGRVMRWHCERDCGFSGSKAYATPTAAAHYAAAFDHEASDDLGRRAPLSLLPLRLARRDR